MPAMKKLGAVSEQERHLETIACLLFHDGHLFSGAEDGKIKMWTPDLKLVTEVQAHPVNVYSLTADGDTIYSSSNDGSIKAWSIKEKLQGPGEVIQAPCDDEVMKLVIYKGKLYAGDVAGMVTVFENRKKKGQYEILEEVGDMAVMDNLLYTCKDTYLTITEMIGEKMTWAMRKSMQGRCPMAISANRLCFCSRDGRCIQIHDNSKENNFEEVAGIPAHEMIIMAMCISNDGAYCLTAGYDRVVKRWDIGEDPAAHPCTGELHTDQVVTAMCTGEKTHIYVGGSSGYLIRADAA